MDAKCRAVPIWDTQMPERDPFGDGSDGAHTARETRETVTVPRSRCAALRWWLEGGRGAGRVRGSVRSCLDDSDDTSDVRDERDACFYLSICAPHILCGLIIVPIINK